jgi:two-component system chemotaxis response regulator CheB
MRVLILTSSGGTAHDAAAEALRDWLRQWDPGGTVDIEQVLENASGPYRGGVAFYNWIQQYAPWIHQAYWCLMEFEDLIKPGTLLFGRHYVANLLRQFKPECDLPILITQHLPASFIPVFARQIEAACQRPTDIAADGTPVRPGRIIIALGHGHMLVQRSGEHLTTRISTAPAPSGCVPSVDPMFTSLAHACDGRVLGVVLSGMGRDGVIGAKDLIDAGGTIYAQDADTSAVWGMPGAVARAGLASMIAPPERLGEAVMAQAATAAPR